jgi:hypothetical protein
LLIGIVIGVLLTAKSVKDVAAVLPNVAYEYTLFGLLLFGATWALQGWGMAAVLVAYGLYQIIGRRAGGIANLMSWFHRKPKPAPEAEPHRPEGDTAAHNPPATTDPAPGEDQPAE